jgi:hypothetical protein
MFLALQIQGNAGEWWGCHVNYELIIRERSTM